ncbi:uncharacterized protein LOC116706807 [Etheostoma spectabile]|uniref:uncharacterized protein LOC116706807 n=1 Tax=Etheostoma spectabile TaxID=54343 RepID=UPI0013AEB851|nr:uncharacterized protein LOC116706807 [Etheostoma spectabile]
MEHKLILAVSGFPSLYDTNSPTYRDLNMRAESWRQVSEIVGVPESECRRKWKTLRDQHRRERQREKERRESGIGLFNYRPWRYSAILSFLNPFIDARAAGTNGWALDPQPSHLHPAEMGCSTTTDTRSDDDDYDIFVADATTTTSSSSSEFAQRKRPFSAHRDVVRFKAAKTELGSDPAVAVADARDDCGVQTQAHDNMKELFEMMMQSVTSLAASLASSQPSSSQPAEQTPHVKTEEPDAEVVELSDESDGEAERGAASPRHSLSARPARARRKSGVDGLLEDFLQRTEAREAQRERELDPRDDVTLFLLSLAPAMRRLPPQKQSWVRTKMQHFLHEAEFGAASFQ